MSAPLAYFLTWTTYGTRVHGDARGTVGPFARTPGTPLMPADPALERDIHIQIKQPPYVMEPDDRTIVDRAIRDHCAIREWAIHALNVRSNHVHIVVTAQTRYSPETVMAQLKSWGTRRLRAAGRIGPDREVWTDHGSTRWINHELGFSEAVDYVLNQQ